jgi:hypothetical protein
MTFNGFFIWWNNNLFLFIKYKHKHVQTLIELTDYEQQTIRLLLALLTKYEKMRPERPLVEL